MKPRLHAVLLSAAALVLAVGVTQAFAAGIVKIIDSSGDGSWPLSNPYRVAVDLAGNVYVAGYASHSAFKISPAGAIARILDTGSTPAGVSGPFGIAAGPGNDANVYVAIRDLNSVYRISPDGTVLAIIDESGDGMGHSLHGPLGVAVDHAGNVYVPGVGYPDEETGGNAFKITPDGMVAQVIDAAGDGQGNPLLLTGDVAVDGQGNVYVSGRASNNVFRVAPDGTVTEIIDASGDGLGNALAGPWAVAADAAGNAYVAGYASDNVFRIAADGTIVELIDANGDGAGNPLDFPFGLATDVAGNVYVAAQFSSNAFRVAPTGEITVIVGPDGDGIGNALDDASGIAVSQAGKVYVTGAASNNVFRIELLCGNGTVDPGEQCDDGNNFDDDCCSRLCRFELEGSPCDDSNACTTTDVCESGVCVGTCAVGKLCGAGCKLLRCTALPGSCRCRPPQ